jgi:FtsH-binding integral membrane protein
MQGIIDDELTDQKTSKFTKDAFKMMGLGILMYGLLAIIMYNLSFEARMNNLHVVVTVLLSFTIMVISLNGVILSTKAFLKPVEKGVLKYFAAFGNGLLLLIFGLINFANGLDLYREFFM